MVLQTLLGVQEPFMTFVCAYWNGVMIEGASRWGYDPIWKIPPPEEPKEEWDSKTLPNDSSDCL